MRKGDDLTIFIASKVKKIRSLNLPDPQGLSQACSGQTLPLPLPSDLEEIKKNIQPCCLDVLLPRKCHRFMPNFVSTQCNWRCPFRKADRLMEVRFPDRVKDFSLLHTGYGIPTVQQIINSMEQSPPEKLTGPQLLKKFHAFYDTRRFITAFTTARHLSLS